MCTEEGRKWDMKILSPPTSISCDSHWSKPKFVPKARMSAVLHRSQSPRISKQMEKSKHLGSGEEQLGYEV
jgi:hypothetical protein